MTENYRDRLFGFLKSRAVGQPGDLFTEVPRERPSSAPLPADDLGARFCSELNAVGGEASDLASRGDPAAELGGWLQGLGLKTAVIDSDPGGYPGSSPSASRRSILSASRASAAACSGVHLREPSA